MPDASRVRAQMQPNDRRRRCGRFISCGRRRWVFPRAGMQAKVESRTVASPAGDLMIIAHVWKFRGSKSAWGHAAVEITGEAGSDCYISWWPGGARQPTFPWLASKAPFLGNIYSAPANKGQTRADDWAGEGNLPPDHSLVVHGLDARKIKTKWDQFQVAPPNWSSLDVNCAMVAAYALRWGGADEVISGVTGWWHSWNSVWKPNDIIKLVEAINAGASAAK